MEFIIILAIILGILFYFIPTIIAFARKKNNKVAILCMNFFLGWALIGWVIALVWAVSNDANK